MAAKTGRNQEFCKRYRAEGREEKNRARKIKRHEGLPAKRAKKLARRAELIRLGKRKNPIVPRGTARRARRAALQRTR